MTRIALALLLLATSATAQPLISRPVAFDPAACCGRPHCDWAETGELLAVRAGDGYHDMMGIWTEAAEPGFVRGGILTPASRAMLLPREWEGEPVPQTPRRCIGSRQHAPILAARIWWNGRAWDCLMVPAYLFRAIGVRPLRAADPGELIAWRQDTGTAGLAPLPGIGLGYEIPRTPDDPSVTGVPLPPTIALLFIALGMILLVGSRQ